MARVLPKRVSKALLLFFLPAPLIGVALGAVAGGDLLRLGGAAAALGLFFAGAVSVRKGLQQEAQLGARRYMDKAAKPFKLLGSLLVGGATALTTFWLANEGVGAAVTLGLGAIGGSMLTYGLDPRPKWDSDELDRSLRQEVLGTLAAAEEKILGIEGANAAIDHPELSDRLRNITQEARDILELLEKQPQQVRHARKFLGTYLDGARQVADGYARTHAKAGSIELETRFASILTTIEEAFEEQHRKLLDDEVMDLDVNIEVLETQLQREGI